jgi:hypothetical protein
MCRTGIEPVSVMFLLRALVLGAWIRISRTQFSPDDIQMLHQRAESAQLSPSQMSYFNLQISSGLALKEDLEYLKENSKDEIGNILRVKSELLQKTLSRLMEMTNPSRPLEEHRKSTLAAIQRGKKRRLELQRQLEEERFAREHVVYVSNVRKLELVDGTIRSLRHRAIALELSESGEPSFPFDSFLHPFL